MSKKGKQGFLMDIMKVLLATLIGFVVGIVIIKSYKILNVQYEDIGFTLIYLVIIILFLLSLFLYISSVQQYKNMKKVNHMTEDDNFIYQVSLYNKASSKVVNSQNLILLSFGMFITTVTNFGMTKFIFLIAYTVIVAFMMSLIGKHTTKVISEFPFLTNTDVEINPKDPRLLDEIIKHLDEGERLIMLHALSKTYRTIIFMLITLLMILSIYQIVSGDNQYLAMVGITATLIYSTIVYYKKNEEFNR